MNDKRQAVKNAFFSFFAFRCVFKGARHLARSGWGMRAVIIAKMYARSQKIPCSVQSDQAGVFHRTHGGKQLALIKGLMETIKKAEKVLRLDRIKDIADVIVGGNKQEPVEKNEHGRLGRNAFPKPDTPAPRQ